MRSLVSTVVSKAKSLRAGTLPNRFSARDELSTARRAGRPERQNLPARSRARSENGSWPPLPECSAPFFSTNCRATSFTAAETPLPSFTPIARPRFSSQSMNASRARIDAAATAKSDSALVFCSSLNVLGLSQAARFQLPVRRQIYPRVRAGSSVSWRAGSRSHARVPSREDYLDFRILRRDWL